MTNTIRVARTLIHGRDQAELAEDAEALRRVRDCFALLQFAVEGARTVVTSERGKDVLEGLDVMFVDHRAKVHTLAEDALEAARNVGVMVVVRP